MRNFLKQHLNEIIVIVLLLCIGIVLLLVKGCNTKGGDLTAKIYHKNEIVNTIDLSKEKEDESRLFSVNGTYGELIVEVKKNAIRVKISPCPHQDCVNIGWVTTTNKPIICAHNQVLIELVGKTNSQDVVI